MFYWLKSLITHYHYCLGWWLFADVLSHIFQLHWLKKLQSSFCNSFVAVMAGDSFRSLFNVHARVLLPGLVQDQYGFTDIVHFICFRQELLTSGVFKRSAASLSTSKGVWRVSAPSIQRDNKVQEFGHNTLSTGRIFPWTFDHWSSYGGACGYLLYCKTASKRHQLGGNLSLTFFQKSLPVYWHIQLDD